MSSLRQHRNRVANSGWLIFSLVVCLLACADTVNAQTDPDSQQQSAASVSPLQKLGRLHNKAKRKLSGWGRKVTGRSSEPETANDPNAIPSAQPKPAGTARQVSYAASAQQYEDEVLTRHGAPPQHYSEPRGHSHRSPDAYPDLPHPRPADRYQQSPSNANLGNHRQAEYPPVDHSTRGYSQGNSSLMNEPAMYPAAVANQANGHFNHGPAMSRQATGDSQITATQRAMELDAKNRLLESARDSLKAENKRLQMLLTENRQLLTDIEGGIQTARDSLTQANRENAQLKQDIAALESKQERQAQETARVLASIRNNLDDVLMQEITSKDGLDNGR